MICPVYRRATTTALTRALAYAFLAGTWNERALVRRGRAALDRRPPWLLPVVRDVLEGYHRPPQDRPRELAAFIAVAMDRVSQPKVVPAAPRVRRWFTPEPAMARRRWPVPDLPSLRAVGEFLRLSHGALAWLSAIRSLERSVPHERLRHYRYAWLSRGERPPRVIESPKYRLKVAQRVVLHEILDRIPAHPCAHGFTRGRSALSNATEHVSQKVVIRLDLEDFFASIEARRVYGIFRTAGYPEAVAHLLTALATNVVAVTEWARVPRPLEPAQIAAHHRLGRRLATPHLPQGAPTSPALANLAAFALDRRVAGLAAALGGTYTRYADDLTISGDGLLLSRAGDVRTTIANIAAEEGFAVNERKSALMTRAGRQRVCGIVVNDHPNVPRDEYDRLRAILHNAARNGPAGENRAGVPDFRAHLLGRIGWGEAVNPARGAKLRARFAQIAWE